MHLYIFLHLMKGTFSIPHIFYTKFFTVYYLRNILEVYHIWYVLFFLFLTPKSIAKKKEKPQQCIKNDIDLLVHVEFRFRDILSMSLSAGWLIEFGTQPERAPRCKLTMSLNSLQGRW